MGLCKRVTSFALILNEMSLIKAPFIRLNNSFKHTKNIITEICPFFLKTKENRLCVHYS